MFLVDNHLLVVELSEVVDDDGDGEGHDEDAGNGAAGADDFPASRDGRHVAVTDGGHGDDGPPEGGRNAGEPGGRLVLLGKVAEAGKDEDAHGQEEHEQAQLLVAVLQGEGDRLEAGRVASQLEDSHNTHDPEHL